jgi:hypothetical protein
MAEKVGFDALMYFICPQHGFCGSVVNGEPRHVTDYIPIDGQVSADEFVEWVFLADDMDPAEDLDKWQKYKDGIKTAFIEHMGSEVVDAQMLRWTN